MSRSTLVRLHRDMYEVLHELAQQEGVPMQEILSKAIEDYRRSRFFDQAREAYAALQADPQAWKDYQTEQVELEGTLMDGLDEYETPAVAEDPVLTR